MTLGEKLQLMRRAGGLSQEQLAARLDISRQAISKWENGEAVPGTEYILPLSRIFDVTADYLLDDSLGSYQPAPPGGQTPQPPAKGLPDKGQLISGAIMGGLGALGLLIIWVLSTMLPVWYEQPYTYFDAAGQLWHSSQQSFGYGFFRFIAFYRLYAPIAILLILLAVGACLLYRWLRRHKAKGPTSP